MLLTVKREVSPFFYSIYGMELYPKLQEYISSILQDLESISHERRQLLTEVSNYVSNQPSAQLNFICTHNSRRSHLAQIWAHVAAQYFGVKIKTYSGGTESTAFHPNAIAALERAGFRFVNPGGSNPKYEVSYGNESPAIVCFSKVYDEDPNPKADFAAVMTCSEADADCPVVFGAAERIRLLYEDPKVGDNTPQEEAKYDERCRQIATEMFYAFSRIKNSED